MRLGIAQIAAILAIAVAHGKLYSGPPEGLAWGFEALKSGWGPESALQRSGYVAVNRGSENAGHVFFWLFEKRVNSSNAPLVLWMTGGPGCSSELAVFYENGPYRFDKNGSVTINPFAWNEVANVLFVDQPIGTGFSYADSQNSYVTNSDQVAEDMYVFLKSFFEQFPQYQPLDFFVTGESYAGHYIPAVSRKILRENKNIDPKSSQFINLKGFAIGNGLVQALTQYRNYAPFAESKKLISQSVRDQIQSQLVPTCQRAIENGESGAEDTCNGIMSQIHQYGGNFNTYDVRKQCDPQPMCYDFSPLESLMTDSDVLNALGVSSQASSWESCNGQVHSSFSGSDWVNDFGNGYVSELLDNGIRGLAYYGTEDFICNYQGGWDWSYNLNWSRSKDFQAKSAAEWKVDGVAAGHVVQLEQTFAFLTVSEAGHLVPMDQPARALEMLRRFVGGQGF